MTTLFAAAITHLTVRMNSRGEGSEKNELRQAIRVLEAAEKVDKRRLVSLIDGSELRHALTSGGAADPQMYVIDTEAEGQLLALLSALPDGTPEGKE